MKVYKLTDQNFMTYKDTKWGENVTHITSGKDWLCSSGWLHYYHDPYLAAFFNPIHANIKKPVLWEAKGEGKHLNNHDVMGGCTKLTTLTIIPLPEFSLLQRVEFAIRCNREFCNNKEWKKWATNWLESNDEFKYVSNDAIADAFAAVGSNSPAANATEAVRRAYKGDATVAYSAAYSVVLALNKFTNKPINLKKIIKQVFPNYGVYCESLQTYRSQLSDTQRNSLGRKRYTRN